MRNKSESISGNRRIKSRVSRLLGALLVSVGGDYSVDKRKYYLVYFLNNVAVNKVISIEPHINSKAIAI